MITIYIAEDDPLLLSFLTTILGGEADFRIVGQSAHGAEVVPDLLHLRPDLLLMDVHLTGLSGLRILERLWDVEDPPVVLVLSGDDELSTQMEAARNGAMGFLPKLQAATQLAAAIRAVAGGELWFDRKVVDRIFREHHQLVRQFRDAQRPANQLSDREREVLCCVARGLTNPQIAAELFMSVHTVKLHIQNILRKLNLPNRTEAAVYAVRQGLTGGEPPSR